MIGINCEKIAVGCGGFVLNKMANLSGARGAKVDHPLADPVELKRIISELPVDNAFKALDEVAGWLESLSAVQDFPVDRLYEALRQLEESAAPHLRRLSRDYLNSPRLSRTEETRLWSINYGFWTLLAANYERCLGAIGEKGRAAELLKTALPVLCVRLIGALGSVLKWEQFHYGPTPGDIWRRLGHVLLLAENAGVAGKAVSMGAATAFSSPVHEYQKVMIFQAASMDSLLPFEIELAERLIAHFLPYFVFTVEATHDSVYWVDLKGAQPPLRMARMPLQGEPTQRFFKPGSAHEGICALLTTLERGGELPAEVKLGEPYHARALIPVLRHLAAYLAPVPPQRRHDRYHVKHRMDVLNGLVNAFVAFSGEFGGRPAGLPVESWVVENVSRGGFGGRVSNIPADWLRVGALLAVQPEGGENWLLGVVRRYHRETESEGRVGIETLARNVTAIELKPCTASSYAAVAGLPALIIDDAPESGEVRVVLPPMTFDLRESLEYTQGGKRHLLMPVALQERTADFELARYRLKVSS